MAAQTEFVTYLLEQLAPVGEVSAKRMFGGWGIYHGGRMFGLVAGETLYLKVDHASRAEFEQEGLRPFRYDRNDGTVAVTSYYEPPSAALDDRELLCRWARKGIEAAGRVVAKKKPGKR